MKKNPVLLIVGLIFPIFLLAGARNGNLFTQEVEYPPETVSEKAAVSISVVLPRGHEFTKNMPLQYEVRFNETGKSKILKKGKIHKPEKHLPLKINVPASKEAESVLEIDLHVCYCAAAPPKLCKFKTLNIHQPIKRAAAGKTILELNPEIAG